MLTEEEETELKRMFIKYDEDGNGMLDNEELLLLFSTLNIRCSHEDANVRYSVLCFDTCVLYYFL